MQNSVKDEARQDNFQTKLCRSVRGQHERAQAPSFLPSRHAFSLFSFVTLVEVAFTPPDDDASFGALLGATRPVVVVECIHVFRTFNI
jgi:hypothetical protein